MDGECFDILAKMLAGRSPRRQVVKGLVAGALGLAFGGGVARPRFAAAELCPYRVPNPSHTPTSNGCGGDLSGFVVPDNYKKADLTPACNSHDVCYDTCNQEKADCDYAFLDDLKVACRAAYPERNNPKHPDSKQYLDCVDRAYQYYTAVDQYAGGAYEAAQTNACLCCQRPACGNACCDDPCMECVSGVCQPKSCGSCATCDPATGACIPIDCGDPCLACVDGACAPKVCGECEECVGGACRPIDCGSPCLVCQNGACVSKCGTGQTCCGGTCVDASKDPNNCGGCGNDPTPGAHICSDSFSPQCLGGVCGCASTTHCPDGRCCTDVITYPNGDPWQCCCNGRISWPSTGQETCNPCGIGTTFCYCNDGIGGWTCCREGEVCGGCSSGGALAVCAAPTSG